MVVSVKFKLCCYRSYYALLKMYSMVTTYLLKHIYLYFENYQLTKNWVYQVIFFNFTAAVDKNSVLFLLSGPWTGLEGRIKADPNPVNLTMLGLNTSGTCNFLFSLSCKEHVILSLYANKHYKH